MHHDRDPAQWPEPMPQAEGLPPLSMEQLQALAQMAQAMTAMSNQPAITSLTVPGRHGPARADAGDRHHRPAEPGGRVPGQQAGAWTEARDLGQLQASTWEVGRGLREAARYPSPHQAGYHEAHLETEHEVPDVHPHPGVLQRAGAAVRAAPTPAG